MNKSDLKNGAVVELRNGDKCIKIDNTLLIVRENNEDMFSWLRLDAYNSDLTFASNELEKYDIVKVDNDVTYIYSGIKYCERAIINHFNTLSTEVNKWTWKRQEDILTNKERAYLKVVIEPIKDKVNFITKSIYLIRQQYIYISLDNNYNDYITLYSFEENTQFKGMELDKKYTLKELGLE